VTTPPLTPEQLDARLVDGDRLLLIEDRVTGTSRCLVMYREEEVSMALFTDYLDRRLVERIGNTNVFR
jgi:hypothetical protein